MKLDPRWQREAKNVNANFIYKANFITSKLDVLFIPEQQVKVSDYNINIEIQSLGKEKTMAHLTK